MAPSGSNGRLANGGLIAREVADVFCVGLLVRIARWRFLADDFSPRQCRRLGWFCRLKEKSALGEICMLCQARYGLASAELIVDAIDAACRYAIIFDYGSQRGYSTLFIRIFLPPFFLLLPLSFSSRLQRFSCPSISLDGDRRALPASSRNICSDQYTWTQREEMSKRWISRLFSLPHHPQIYLTTQKEREKEKPDRSVRSLV